MAKTEKIPGFCTLCKSTCGALFEVEDGKLVRALPNPEHPTGKALCVKGKSAPEIVYSRDRMHTPLRRVNPKTDPKPIWEPVSWNDALSEIGERLRALRADHGMETVTFMTGTPSATGIADSRDWIERLMNKSGACNWLAVTELCNWQKDTGKKYTTGDGIGYPDYENTDLIVFWGFNPSAVWLDQATQAAAARARGAKVLAIDPRRVGFANDADQWLRVRPGADGLLALGMAKVLFENNDQDSDFLRSWTNATFLVRDDNGEFLRAHDLEYNTDPNAFVVCTSDKRPREHRSNHVEDLAVLSDALLDASIDIETTRGPVRCSTAFAHLSLALERYPMSEITDLTGVSEAEIRSAAGLIGRSETVSYYTWTGLEQQSDATQINRMLSILMSVTGSFDAKGGNLALPKVPVYRLASPESLSHAQRQKRAGKNAHPLGPAYHGMLTSIEFTRAVLEEEPYRIRALVGFGGNPVVTRPDSTRFAHALQCLDFYVHCDIFHNPSSDFADFLLPVNTPWEREALRIGFTSGHRAAEHIQLRPRAVDPVNDARSDTEIVMSLADELGLRSEFFHGDIDAGHNAVLAPTGITVADLRDAPNGLRYELELTYRKFERIEGDHYRGMQTESGKIELYSALLGRNGLAPVPEFDTARLAPDPKFPFALTTTKTVLFCHSQHRHVPSLRRRETTPTVSIAPQAAERLGLKPDDWVTVRTAHGQIRMMLRTDGYLAPDTAIASFGWWQDNQTLGLPGYDPLSSGGSNYNLLVPETERDAISGAASLRSQSCQILSADLPKDRWQGFSRFIVTDRVRAAQDVTQLTLSAVDGRTLPDFEPGQHLVMRARDKGESKDKMTRCYSLISPAAQAGRTGYQIAVRHVFSPPDRPELPPGAMSGWINTQLEIGDHVEIKAPMGDFILSTVSPRPMVLIAGGIGITPFMSFLETLCGRSNPPCVHLHYANRNLESEAFGARLVELEMAIPNFRMFRYFSDPSDDLPNAVRAGFISAASVLEHGSTDTPAIYFCGPPPMRNALVNDLFALGHPPSLFFEEQFGAATLAQEELPDGPFEVTFKRTGRCTTWRNGDGALLNLAEQNGVSIGSGCRAGKCESCAVRIIQGKVLYPNLNRPIDPQACLTCQAVPDGDVILDV